MSTMSLINKPTESYSFDKIPQYDGNDSFSDDDDVDDHNRELTVVANEQDISSISAGFVFEDSISTPSINQQSISSKTANFGLNKDKQIESLGADACLPNFDITINDSDKNINIQCSTAFYDTVAKPIMCGLAVNSTLNFNNISINCNHIDHNRDNRGVESSIS